MTTRHVERLIDFNHEMLEPLQFHIDEDIHYKKEDVGIRASGYLYLSGKYKAKEGIRLFQELLEVDILAPFEKIADESAFAVHVKDYDYSVRDGDLLIDITIEIDGLDESTVRPDVENELEQLESEMFEEDDLDDLDDLVELDDFVELNDLDNLDVIDNVDEMAELDEIIKNDSVQTPLEPKSQAETDEQPEPRELPQPDMTPEIPQNVYEEALMERNVMPENIMMPETTGWNLADLIAFENDNTTYGLDFQDQESVNPPLTDIEKIAIPEIERQIRNYVTSKQLTQMLQNSLDDMQNEPVRILFDLQELEDAVPAAVTTTEGKAALQEWKQEVERLQKQYQVTQPAHTASYEGNHDEMAELIRLINANADDQPIASANVKESQPLTVNKDMIHEMNQDIHPKDASYYQQSHAKKPLAFDVNQKTQKDVEELAASNYQFEPKLPNLDVPFTRDTVFPWEMRSMYDKYDFTVQPTPPTPLKQPDCPIRYQRERKAGSMNPYETQATSSPAPVLESDEMKDLIDLIETQEDVKQQIQDQAPSSVTVVPEMQMPVKEVVEPKMTPPVQKNAEKQSKTSPSNKKMVSEELHSNEDAACAATTDISSIEDLFEDADSKVVNMRIIIARENDTYESLARRYQVSESKLTQQNHNKPIHERALIIIPLD